MLSVSVKISQAILSIIEYIEDYDTRSSAKNRESTDCRIEDLRIERFPSWGNSEYFRRCIVGLANIHEEIETVWGGNIVRLTPIGLQSCRRFPGWQKDF